MSQQDHSFNFGNALTEYLDQVVVAYEASSDEFIYFNAAFEQVFNQSRHTITRPGDLFQLVHREDQQYVREVYEQVLAGESKKSMEFRILLPDKSERWLRVKPILLQENGKQIIAGVAEDITDFKSYSDIAQKFSNKKNAIIQILSHDLAGPLGTIQALSSLVAPRIQKYGDEELTHVIGLITQTSKGSIRLIKDFVAQEFLESAETALIIGRVNIVEKIREVMEQYQNSQQNTTQTFQLFSSDPSIYVEIDEVKFIQVITNLISNAIKFTPDDGMITIRIEDKEERGTLLISVEDNGIGIPKKYHKGLFDKFTKARRPGLREEPSVGLGMSIIKTIVEWHKGKIWFDSEENKGTTFYVEIPGNQS